MPVARSAKWAMGTSAPPPCSLTTAEVIWLAEQIGSLPGNWTMEPVQDPNSVSAVLLPAEGDRYASAFLIDGVPGGIRVIACRWDELRVIGLYATIAQALQPVADTAATAMRLAPFPNLQ